MRRREGHSRTRKVGEDTRDWWRWDFQIGRLGYSGPIPRSFPSVTLKRDQIVSELRGKSVDWIPELTINRDKVFIQRDLYLLSIKGENIIKTVITSLPGRVESYLVGSQVKENCQTPNREE